MEKQVVVVGETACEGVAQSVQAREEELADVLVEIKEIQAGLDDVLHGSQHKS